MRLQSRPTARESRETQFIICLDDMKRLQIIHLKDRGGVADARERMLNARKLDAPAHSAVRSSSSGLFRFMPLTGFLG